MGFSCSSASIMLLSLELGRPCADPDNGGVTLVSVTSLVLEGGCSASRDSSSTVSVSCLSSACSSFASSSFSSVLGAFSSLISSKAFATFQKNKKKKHFLPTVAMYVYYTVQ